MSRQTFQTLYTDCQSRTQDSSATSLAWIKDEINRTVTFILGALKKYVDNKSTTFTTVDGTQFYDYPADLVTVENLYMTIGSVDYTMIPISSALEWSRLNAILIAPTTFPTHFYPRRDDLGIYPVPQDAYITTLEYAYYLKAMSAADYVTGTATFTNVSAAVVGSGTTYTAAMVGRWIKGGNGLWYRISAFTDGTNITIDRTYEGDTEASVTTAIGESPEIPVDMHELIVYRVLSNYFSGLRGDTRKGAYWNNMFWTGDPQKNDRKNADGGFLAAKARYSSRTDSRLIDKRTPGRIPIENRIWGYSIS